LTDQRETTLERGTWFTL